MVLKSRTVRLTFVRSLAIVTLATDSSLSALVSGADAQPPPPKFDMDQLRKERPIQHQTPVMAYTDRVPGEKWVPASTKKKLKPGQRVDIGTMEGIDEVVIQRLTNRTYWS